MSHTLQPSGVNSSPRYIFPEFFPNSNLKSTRIKSADLILVDFKLEFGKNSGKIYLGDEFTPDGCRVWDKETKKKLDKDRFRLGLGDVVESYQEIAHRLGVNLT